MTAAEFIVLSCAATLLLALGLLLSLISLTRAYFGDDGQRRAIADLDATCADLAAGMAERRETLGKEMRQK